MQVRQIETKSRFSLLEVPLDKKTLFNLFIVPFTPIPRKYQNSLTERTDYKTQLE